MENAHPISARTGSALWLLTTDFCPGANRYLHWLKEPIGWFVLAAGASIVIGLYVNPVGWTIAAALAAMISVGMLWPTVAVRAAACRLEPQVDAVHEEDVCQLTVSVRNRTPLPLWGLFIEGYLDGDGQQRPTAALACVPPSCSANYHIAVRPQLRGSYPVENPRVACSFPFGIWTARRRLSSFRRLTVWPAVYKIDGACPMIGTARGDIGDGPRGGRNSEPVGVRAFRRGDSPRHIHWAQSARMDSLIVAERGGPQCVEADVSIDTARPLGLDDAAARDCLKQRLRVAASLLAHLHAARIPVHVRLGGAPLRYAAGPKGGRQLLDALARVPACGIPVPAVRRDMPRDTSRVKFLVSGNDGTRVVLSIIRPHGSRRTERQIQRIRLDGSRALQQQLKGLWHEVRYAAGSI